VAPIIGRLLTKDDDAPDAALVGVISDKYWARWFGHDPNVIGPSVRIEGKAVTVVGLGPLEITSRAERPLADLTMAIAGMPKVPPGGRASDVTIPNAFDPQR
jgi:hypothetical protein